LPQTFVIKALLVRCKFPQKEPPKIHICKDKKIMLSQLEKLQLKEHAEKI